jgi:hypothetical protein
MKCLWVLYSFLRGSWVEWLTKTRNEDALLYDRCIREWELIKSWMGILKGRAASAKQTGRDFKPGRNRDVKATNSRMQANAAVRVSVLVLVSSFAFVGTPHSYAQGQAQPPAKRELADLRATDQPLPDKPVHVSNNATSESAGGPASSAEGEISPAVAKELEELRGRIEELEAALKARNAAEQPAVAAAPAKTLEPAPVPSAAKPDPAAPIQVPAEATPTSTLAAKPAPTEPFSVDDWTWLNGNPRNHDTPLATKYFTPEFRADANYTEDYNQPKDHTLGGSTETFRNGEVQLEQLSFGGDLRVGNVRGRVLTMFGMFATTTPRNDASYGVGQWDLRDAYKYVSEAWGGYHFNVNHGLNIDAGIFVSYIGLFSYYNYDNWTYQPSYVSSNTPWFFNGVRIQWFPTEKLKIEPWIINGWQSYAKYNGHMGLGGQILYRPKPWLSMVFNNYGMGTDTLGVPGRSRIHTDDSVEVRYFNRPENLGLDKMAFSLTGDLGCEYGGSGPGTIVSCHNSSHGHPKQSFAGWMVYNRFWFHKDLFGITLGGGRMDNPGRYLTLLPPIAGADAVSGSPYFQAAPGTIYKAWDSTITFDWMPSQFITFRFETGYRHANVPYWTGRQGLTPPGFNPSFPPNPADYICSNGTSSGIGAGGTNPSGSILTDPNLPAVEAACGTPGSLSGVWQPDLRKTQTVSTIAIMVKF